MEKVPAEVFYAAFLSTLSLRRATDTLTDDVSSGGNFYPRSPCGERLDSISNIINNVIFLSTLSLRRATPSKLAKTSRTENISIHALLAESDRPRQVIVVIVDNFYPRSPCGERPPIDVLAVSALPISIHALLAESDIIIA